GVAVRIAAPPRTSVAFDVGMEGVRKWTNGQAVLTRPGWAETLPRRNGGLASLRGCDSDGAGVLRERSEWPSGSERKQTLSARSRTTSTTLRPNMNVRAIRVTRLCCLLSASSAGPIR